MVGSIGDLAAINPARKGGFAAASQYLGLLDPVFMLHAAVMTNLAIDAGHVGRCPGGNLAIPADPIGIQLAFDFRADALDAFEIVADTDLGGERWGSGRAHRQGSSSGGGCSGRYCGGLRC